MSNHENNEMPTVITKRLSDKKLLFSLLGVFLVLFGASGTTALRGSLKDEFILAIAVIVGNWGVDRLFRPLGWDTFILQLYQREGTTYANLHIFPSPGVYFAYLLRRDDFTLYQRSQGVSATRAPSILKTFSWGGQDLGPIWVHNLSNTV